MCRENLEKLRELTPKLSNYVTQPSDARKIIIYKTSKGELCAYSIFRDGDKIAVLHSMMRKGETFLTHNHTRPITEILFIYDGVLEVIIDGVKKVLKSPDYVVFENEQEHEMTAMTDVKLVGITIPADKNYP